MAQIDIGSDLANDPWATTTDDISEFYHVQSTGFGGPYKARAVPAVNYPVITGSRIFHRTPMVIDRSDLTGSRPIKVVDTTIGSTMSRVTTAPTGNEYRIPPASSIRRDVIEVSSTKVGNIIDFDFYGEGTVFNADEFNTFRQYFAQSTIVSNLTISDTDYLGSILVGHTSTTALVTVTLPTVADNIERRIRIQNTGTGLTKIDGEGAETISLFGTALSQVYLLTEDDYVELVSEGTEWKVEHCYISMITNMLNKADWTDTYGGSAFTYDNKSAAVDLTGQHIQIADGGSLQKAVILYDSGGTGASGTMYVYYITDRTTSLGVWTNNQTCTCGSGGYTFDVNEVSGSSKDINYDLHHRLGIDFKYIKFHSFWNATDSYTGALDVSDRSNASTSSYGIDNYQIDTNSIRRYYGASGFAIIQNGAGGSYQIIDGEDSYIDYQFIIQC